MDDFSLALRPTAIMLGCLIAVCAGAGVVAAILWRVWPFYRQLIRRDIGARPSDGSHRFEPLDGLRGLLCLMIVVHHTLITLLLPLARRGDWGRAVKLGRPYMRLNVAVSIFFCLTAFLFYHRAIANVAAGRPAMEPRRFFIGRLMRVGPAVLLSGVIIFVLDAIYEHRYVPSNPEDFWPMLLRIVSLGATGGGKDVVYNAGVLWTLGYEWMFYLSFPLLAAACAAGISPGVRLLAWVGVVGVSNGGLGGAEALMFLPGLVAAHLVERPGFVRFARSWPGSAVASLAFVGTVAAVSTMLAATLLLTGLMILFPLVAAGCDLFGLLRLPALRAIGVVSFSVYLLHGFVLYLVRPWLTNVGSIDGPQPAHAVGAMIAVAIAAVVISFVTFRWIEHTGIELGRRWGHARPT